MIGYVSFEKTTWAELPNKFEAGTPNIAGAVGLGAAIDYLDEVGRDALAAHEQQVLRYATERLSAIPGVRIVGTAAHKAGVLSFVVEDPPLSALDVGTRLDLDGVAVRTGHHCCQPLMERLGLPATARASFAAYNTMREVDVFADALAKIVGATRPRLVPVSRPEPAYPAAAAASPQAAAAELTDVFDFLEDWTEKYQHLIEIGSHLPPMPDELKTDATRVPRCQSTVFLHARKKPGTKDVVEFLADSDADIVRGLLAVLQRLYSGQHAGAVEAFDAEAFLQQLGLDRNLTMGRRTGLDEMIRRVRAFAADVAAGRGES
jgi:cysteine desulfurase/selenocysteine lyase